MQDKIDNNLYIKLNRVRFELSQQQIKKSGHNKFANFRYMELQDFMPLVNKFCDEQKLTTFFNVAGCDCESGNQIFIFRIIDSENPNSFLEYTLPIEMAGITSDLEGGKTQISTNIQKYGAVLTYMRRYAYMIAFELTENDVVDSLDQTGQQSKQQPKQQPKQQQKQVVKNEAETPQQYMEKQDLEVKKSYVSNAVKSDKNLTLLIKRLMGDKKSKDYTTEDWNTVFEYVEKRQNLMEEKNE